MNDMAALGAGRKSRRSGAKAKEETDHFVLAAVLPRMGGVLGFPDRIWCMSTATNSQRNKGNVFE